MARFLALLFLFLCGWPGGAFASIELQLEQYRSRHYESLTAELRLNSRNPSELLLLYKAQLKLNQKEEAHKTLRQMNDLFEGPLRQVVLYERMDFYEESGNLEALLDLAAHFPRDINNDFLEARLASHLSDLLAKNRAPGLREKLDKIFDRFESMRADSDLLQRYLETLPEADPKVNWALEQIFREADVDKLPETVQRQFGFIKGAMIRYKDSILAHFKTQYKKRNFSYLRNNLPLYLKYYREGDQEVFNELRRLYWRTFFSGRAYTRAIQMLSDKAQVEEFAFSEGERLGLLARFWLAKDRLEEAKEVLVQLDQGGFVKEANEGYFGLGERYFYRGQWLDAFEALRRVDASDFEEEDLISLQWKLFLINHRVGHLVNLQRIADWAAEYPFSEDTAAARFCYWGYKLGLYRKGTYLNCYQRYPTSFYGLKSKVVSQPYGAFSGSGPDLEFRFKRRPLTVAEQSYFDLLLTLYGLDENRLGDSLVLAEERDLKDLTYFDSLRSTLSQAERFYTFYLLVQRHYDELLGDNYYGTHYIMPLLYPLAFQEQVERNAENAKVSKQLVYAVMREESRYRAYVKSGAGAIGLMQLMPRTARYVGRRHKLRVESHNLIDPDLNLKLGSTYLNMLSTRFDGNLYYTLAAYNGGATNVKRWVKKVSSDDMDYFVELITFSETKNYVKRVLKSYYLYQSIYGPR
ncbi:MAG: transglycosylase SLT domain-containing protein [bacterium]|nr:transglycosylase SLT domain-containing protein [bacterium]